MSELPLDALRREPDREFADRLGARLRQQPRAGTTTARRPLTKLAAGIAAAAVIGFAFALPAVRGSADSFLALFREVTVVAIPVETDAPLTRAEGLGLDLPRLIGERVQLLEEGSETAVLSPEAASAAAGFVVAMPAFLPTGTVRSRITVTGRRGARVTADTTRLRRVLAALGIRDIQVPDDLDGQAAVIRTAPMVTTAFAAEDQAASLIQGPMPEVILPAGLDLQKMGEIGLRLLGMPVVEAHEFAQAVDWRTTLIVPVPPTASRFRHLLIGGSRGMAIEGQRQGPETGVGRGRWNLLLWVKDGRVFALRSTMRLGDALEMANSLP